MKGFWLLGTPNQSLNMTIGLQPREGLLETQKDVRQLMIFLSVHFWALMTELRLTHTMHICRDGRTPPKNLPCSKHTKSYQRTSCGQIHKRYIGL